MFCPKCGKQLDDGAKFCFNCGFSIESVNKNAQNRKAGVQPKPVEVPRKPEVEPMQPIKEQQENMQYDSSYPNHKKRNVKMVLVVVIAVIVAAIVVILVAQHLGYTLPFLSKNNYTVSSDHATKSDTKDDENIDSKDHQDNDDKDKNSNLNKNQNSDQDSDSADSEETDKQSSEEGIHTYEVITADMTWNEAYNDCIKRGGYLARINSREEWNAIIAQIQASNTEACYFYVSGTRNDGGSSYYWKNENGELYGEPLNSSAFWGNDLWLENEPSFQDGDVTEDAMAILYMKSANRWVLNDVANNPLETESYLSGKIAYICEYE